MAWLKLGNRNPMGGRNLISAQNKKGGLRLLLIGQGVATPAFAAY